MANPELVDSQQESPIKISKQYAIDRFNAIFYNIKKIKSYKNFKGEEIIIWTYNSPDFKTMNIEKNGKVTYRLELEKGQFKLKYWPNLSKVVYNITPEELVNDILPNFEKRLIEANEYQKQKRQRAVRDGNQYAYEQDQQDAYWLLLENGLA